MAIPNSTWTELATTTIAKYSREIADNVLNHNPLLKRLKQRGGTAAVGGGTQILENLEYAENATFTWYSGPETLDVSASDVLTSAAFDWKEANANVVILGIDKAKNSGSKESIHNLLRARIRNAEHTIENNLAAAITYSNTENDGKSIGGLQHLVADLPTSGTVGGIDAGTSSNAWWRNQYYDFSSEGVTASATTIQNAMNTVYLNCTRGNDAPDLIPAGITYFQYYLNSLLANQRFTSDDEASTGFRSLKFWGGAADVIYDSNIAATRMYFLNTKYIKFRPHSDYNMVQGEDRMSVNQDATVIPMFFKGNMTVSNRSLQGVVVA